MGDNLTRPEETPDEGGIGSIGRLDLGFAARGTPSAPGERLLREMGGRNRGFSTFSVKEARSSLLRPPGLPEPEGEVGDNLGPSGGGPAGTSDHYCD